MTTYVESEAGIVVPQSPNGHAPSLAQLANQLALTEATLRDLEDQIAGQGWTRLGDATREFSRQTLDGITASARTAYLKNPLINRAVEIGALYVWGQDMSKNADEPDVETVLDAFWELNAATLTGSMASRSLEVELEVTGNVFFVFFPDRVTGDVKVRTVPIEEVREIVTNPDDRAEVWFYKREWHERGVAGGISTQRAALYPDWQHQPAAGARPTTIVRDGQTLDVHWESPMAHVRSGAFMHWRWGVSEVYPALDWAKAYKEMLEHDVTRSAALARFVWNLTTAGGAAGIAATKAKLGALPAGTGTPGANPPPAQGSTFVKDRGAGGDLEPIRVAGATLDPDHSRPARLMAAAALGVPDHFFDADVGNFATSKTLDRPTELRFNERRNLWLEVFDAIVAYVIDANTASTRGLLRGRALTDEQRHVDLAFPDLLERSATERVEAVVTAATLSGHPTVGTIADDTTSRLLLGALQVDDIDAELQKLEEERAAKAEEEAAAAKAALELAQAQRAAQPVPPTTPENPANPNAPVPPNAPTPPNPNAPATEASRSRVTVTNADLEQAAAWWDARFAELKGAID